MSRDDPGLRRAASPVLIAFGGVGLLCVMDAVMKHVVGSTNAFSATFFRAVLTLALSAPLWAMAGRPALTRDVWRAHAVRGAVTTVSACAFFWALTVLPLAEAVTLSFVAPLIIPFVAWAVLGERPRGAGLIAALIGFAGVVVTTQGAPPGEDSPARTLGILVMLAAGVAWALSLVLLRGRAGRDGPAIVTMMGSLVPAVLLAPVAAGIGEWPDAATWPWLGLAALLATAGVWMLSRAYALAEAQVLAPLEFTALLWAALLGWAFFGEVPRVEVWIGAAIIIGACLYMGWDERRRS